MGVLYMHKNKNRSAVDTNIQQWTSFRYRQPTMDLLYMQKNNNRPAVDTGIQQWVSCKYRQPTMGQLQIQANNNGSSVYAEKQQYVSCRYGHTTIDQLQIQENKNGLVSLCSLCNTNVAHTRLSCFLTQRPRGSHNKLDKWAGCGLYGISASTGSYGNRVKQTI